MMSDLLVHRPARPPRRHRLALLGLCLSLPLLLAGCGRNESSAQAAEPSAAEPVLQGQQLRYPERHPQLQLLKTVPARAGQAVDQTLPAKLVWDESRTQRIVPPLAGRVEQLVADIGQTVRPGSLLARISSPDLGQAQADAARALADQRQAQQQLRRQRELAEAGITARRDLEQAEGDAARADAEAARAQSRLRLYGGGQGVDQQLGLRAGIAGRIVERNLNPGAELRPDQSGPGTPALFVISDPSRLWVLIDAREADLATLRPGTEFELSVPAWPERRFSARVTASADAIDPATRTIKVRAEVDNREGLLKAEMLGTAHLKRQLGSGVVVPAAAVLLNKDRHRVFVQSAPGVFEPRDVELGHMGSQEIVVTRGLEVGEQVVVENSLLLARQFRIAEDDAAPAGAASGAASGARRP